MQQIGKIVHPCATRNLNNDGKSPRMIFTEEHKELIDQAEKWMKDTATTGTVIAALICTISFTAGITLPGGNNGTTGYPIFSGSSDLTIFIVSNTCSLAASATSLIVFLRLMSWGHQVEDFGSAIPSMVTVGVWCLFLSVLLMMSSSMLVLHLLTFAHIGTSATAFMGPIVLSLVVATIYYGPQLLNMTFITYIRWKRGFFGSSPFHY